MLTSAMVTLFLAVLAQASGLTGSIHLPDGVKIAGDDLFVVWTDSCVAKTKAPDVELVQNDFMYAPRALATMVGAKLRVHNGDRAQHNSFALKNVSFDSGLQKPGTTYVITLDKPGVTKVFCRIHPKMAAEVLALPNPCFRKIEGSELSGGFTLPLPQGGKATKVWLWSPRLRSFQTVAWVPGKNVEFAPASGEFLDLPSQQKPVSEREEPIY